MVGVTIDCRLGNQLFQYAFIKALADRFGTSFYINEKVEKFILPQYFQLAGYHPARNKLNRLMLKIQSGKLFTSLNTTEVGTYREGVASDLCDNRIYGGYFQSPFFFSNIENKLHSYIRIKKEYTRKFQEEYGKTFSSNKTIAVHIRRGDYTNLNDWWAENFGSNDLTLSLSYYFNCLDMIKDHRDCKIYFISDDIEFARSAFGHIENAEFAGESLVIDFQIMLNADICVIANSSFAWWAAFLNKKKDKKVFCPEYWLGFKVKKEYPDFIIPPGWIKVTTDEKL